MRIKITKSTTTTFPDGSIRVIEHPRQDAQDAFDDSQVSNALERFYQDRDISLLVELLEEANPAIMRSPEALGLLASAARGELKIGKGRLRTNSARERDKRITAAAEWLKKLGMPLKNAPDKNRNGTLPAQSVCRAIGGRLSLSEDAVYSILREQGKALKNDPLGAFRMSPYLFLGPSWVLARREPTLLEILDYYLPISAAPDNNPSAFGFWFEMRPSIKAAAQRALEKKGRARQAKG